MNEYTTVETKQFRGCGFMTVSKYNNAGDMIYIGDKDSKIITAIDTINYDIIGTFSGHNGIIWNLDISKNDDIMITASGDLTIGFFNTKNGNKIFQSNEKSIPKYVCTQKKYSNTNLVGIICEALTKKSTTYISIYDLDMFNKNVFDEKVKLLWLKQSKPTTMLWLNDNELLIGCDDGKLVCRNINDIDGSMDKEYQIHTDTIKSIVWNKTHTHILTGSLDCTSKQIDVQNQFNVLHTYISNVPINYAIWNHNDRKVILGGGIEAMNVAKTSNNDLNIKIYRTSDQKLTNHINSHFGPIRYIDKDPNSKNFLSASQDGSVKIYFINEGEIIQQSNTDKITFNKFGNELLLNKSLKNETSKIINLSWKPPKTKEPIIKKWVPGMPILKEKDDIFKLNDVDIDIDEKFETLKTQEIEQNTTIRITNLPVWVKTIELEELFDLYGRIEERGIRIKNYHDSTIAFIKYSYHEAALKAIENMDGHAFNHHIIKVEMALLK